MNYKYKIILAVIKKHKLLEQTVLTLLFAGGIFKDSASSYFVFFAYLGFCFYSLLVERNLHITNNITSRFYLKHNAQDLKLEEEKKGEFENEI